MQDCLVSKGHKLEWKDVIRDLDSVTETVVEHGSKTFTIRSQAKGVSGKVLQAVGVALPKTIRPNEEKPIWSAGRAKT